MQEELIQMMADPAALRADKIVELLHVKNLPEYADEYSQAVLQTMIAGLMDPFIPKPTPRKEGNVVEFPLQ